MTVNPQRYTQSQVLCGLRELWPNITGTDDWFDTDTRIDEFMKADGSWDDLDLTEVFRRIEGFFGFACSDKEWTDFFGFDVAARSADEWERTVAPRLTFGLLAVFIAEQALVVASFDPISVFGRTCAPAGVFTGIERLAEKAAGKSLRFPPSARIIDRMRGRTLDDFWTQLRWMTEGAIPQLPAFWREVTGTAFVVGMLAVVIAAFASWSASSPAWFAATSVIAVMCYVAAVAYRRFANPLPPHIATFGDLAEAISKSSFRGQSMP